MPSRASTLLYPPVTSGNDISLLVTQMPSMNKGATSMQPTITLTNHVARSGPRMSLFVDPRASAIASAWISPAKRKEHTSNGVHCTTHCGGTGRVGRGVSYDSAIGISAGIVDCADGLPLRSVGTAS